MTKKLIFYNRDQAGRLHCDACGFDLPERQPFTPALIGTPCPMCGADMLTLADYKAAARAFSVVDFINKWFGFLGAEAPRPEAARHAVSVRVRDGEITIRKSDPH